MTLIKIEELKLYITEAIDTVNTIVDLKRPLPLENDKKFNEELKNGILNLVSLTNLLKKQPNQELTFSSKEKVKIINWAETLKYNGTLESRALLVILETELGPHLK